MYKVKHWKMDLERTVYGTKQSEDLTTWLLFFVEDIWVWEVADNWIPVGQ